MKAAPAPEKNRQACRRCGECCRRGGPAFHLIDRPLIDRGLIPAACLYTIRPGEPVHDNVANRKTYAEADIIKIKGRGDEWTCCFLAEDGSSCRIYEDRPQECRAMQCWDTRSIEKLYQQARLSRQDLLETVEGLWELIALHEERCSYKRLQQLCTRLGADDREDAMAEIQAMVAYDESLRALLIEQGQARKDMLDFLLGRPLTRVLPGFHIQVEHKGDTTRLIYSPLT
jgi:Fe-S-cluster containining protein